MSMPNFNTMRNFPLYVRDFVSEVDYCPACNTYGEDGVCPICGAATERKVYLDNDDCHYYFDVCRSVAIRRYNSEINKINRILKMLAKEYGFDEVYCSAVFGNGEAIYTKVENTQRARIVRAIKEIA